MEGASETSHVRLTILWRPPTYSHFDILIAVAIVKRLVNLCLIQRFDVGCYLHELTQVHLQTFFLLFAF